jgi:hypothetical protein
MGFKEHESASCVPRIPDRFIRGQSRPGLRGSERSSSRRLTITELSSLSARHSARVKCLSFARLLYQPPDFLQAVRQGEGHSNKLVIPTSGPFPVLRTIVSLRHSPDFLQAVSRGGGQNEQHAPRKNSRRAPVPQSAPTAPTSEPQQLRTPKGHRCTVRSLLVFASICGNNNLSTPSCDFASRSPSALRHTPAVQTRCE